MLLSEGPIVQSQLHFSAYVPASVLVGVLSTAAFAGPAALDRRAEPTPTRVESAYFKQTRTLEIDPSRRIVLLEPGSPAAAQLHGSDVLRGFRLVAASAAEAASARSVAGVRFSSPVIRGLDGHFAAPTPTILVQFRPDVPAARRDAILQDDRAGRARPDEFFALGSALKVDSGLDDGLAVIEAANRLSRRPEVLFAEPDWLFSGSGSLVPTDPLFAQAWGLRNTGQSGGLVNFDLNVTTAWDVTLGTTSTIVLILDTGVEQTHPDVAQIPGRDFTTEFPAAAGGPFNGCDSHGTPVAGCVSGRANNGIGACGSAPGVRTISARCFVSTVVSPCNGSWTTLTSSTADALNWGFAQGARISNNSNGYGFTSATVESAYASTYAAGMVHFASAGNNASATISYPSSVANVNSILAFDRTGVRSSFSNFGVGSDFSAPGRDIVSADRTGALGYSTTSDYATVSGTSFAAPYAAGVAALVRSVAPLTTSVQVEQILQRTSRDLSTPGYDTASGWGLLQARPAVVLARCFRLRDFDQNGLIQPSDIFGYLNAYFAGDPIADFNVDGQRQPADIFAFLNAYFGAC
jgi:subtilisin family serine protease